MLLTIWQALQVMCGLQGRRQFGVALMYGVLLPSVGDTTNLSIYCIYSRCAWVIIDYVQSTGDKE